MSRAFTPRTVESLRPKVQSIVDDILDGVEERGTVEIVDEIGYVVPVTVICELLGVPVSDRDQFGPWSSDASRLLDGVLDEDTTNRGLMGAMQIIGYLGELIEDRKANPQDPDIDPISSLLAVRVDGEALPDDMILGALRQFLMVGIVAPTTFIGSAVVHLARHPEHHTLLRDSNALIPDAVEELLRLYTPYRGFARTARCDVRFGDTVVREGEVLAAVFTSGNRDEAVFSNPDEFDLRRPRRDLLTFGRGPHKCPGAPLARMQLEVALEGIVNRTRRIEICGPMTMTDWPEYGPLSVPVRFTR
jgi:cytochrome P450